jgi:glycosyltransferase A (GT-A) superfamily protein (DUF2064 family)
MRLVHRIPDLDMRIAVAGPPQSLEPYAGRCAPGAELTEQTGASFAARQAREIRRGLTEGYRTVILLASDLPDLSADAVCWTVHAARDGHVAIVPAADGGYSLLGSGTALPELERVPMSRADTASALAATVHEKGRSVLVAPFTVADLDEPDDVPDTWRNPIPQRRTHAKQ